jgi:hypothetical protein
VIAFHPTRHLQAAARVPDDDPKPPWEEAADVAADWIWERSEIEGTPPFGDQHLPKRGGINRLEELARREASHPPRASNDSTAARCSTRRPSAR